MNLRIKVTQSCALGFFSILLCGSLISKSMERPPHQTAKRGAEAALTDASAQDEAAKKKKADKYLIMPSLNAQMRRVDQLLLQSSAQGDEAGVRRAIGAGAQPTNTDVQGFSPLYYAIINEHDAIVRILLEGDDSNLLNDHRGGNVFHTAAARSPQIMKTLLTILGQRGTLQDILNARDVLGKTPLHRAAQHGRADNIRALLKAGANANAYDSKGGSPLHDVSIGENSDAVAALLEGGATVDLPRGRPTEPRDEYDLSETGQTPLFESVSSGNLEMVRLLIAAGANVNSWDEIGQTPLHMILRNEEAHKPDVVRELIMRGGDPDAEATNTADTGTPLDKVLSLVNDDKFSILEMADIIREFIRGGASLSQVQRQIFKQAFHEQPLFWAAVANDINALADLNFETIQTSSIVEALIYALAQANESIAVRLLSLWALRGEPLTQEPLLHANLLLSRETLQPERRAAYERIRSVILALLVTQEPQVATSSRANPRAHIQNAMARLLNRTDIYDGVGSAQNIRDLLQLDEPPHTLLSTTLRFIRSFFERIEVPQQRQSEYQAIQRLLEPAVLNRMDDDLHGLLIKRAIEFLENVLGDTVKSQSEQRNYQRLLAIARTMGKPGHEVIGRLFQETDKRLKATNLKSTDRQTYHELRQLLNQGKSHLQIFSLEMFLQILALSLR